ncbi:MAG: V-type ATP synthase subunit I [Nitrososphaerota archaeon]|nr:V-type ATP synthase subunit I [Nitrososphaerota archaeon]
MLKPAAMQKVGVVGLKEDRAKVVSALYDLGAVQIEPLSASAAGLLRAEPLVDGTKEATEQLLRIRSLKAALPPVPIREKRGFSSLEEVLEASKSINIDQEVSQLRETVEKLSSRLEEQREMTDLVRSLRFVRHDLNIFDLESAVSFLGIVPAGVDAELREGLGPSGAVVTHSSGDDPVTLIVTVPREGLEKFGSAIQKLDLKLRRIPPLKGTAEEILAGLEAESRSMQTGLDGANARLAAISQEHYKAIAQVEEQLSIEARKMEVSGSFGFTDTSFAVEGWVPSKWLGSVSQAIAESSSSAKVFKIDADSQDPHGGPPTLLETPRRLRFFESFIRFYSVPLSNEVDPSMIFAVAFPLFFGLMIGDVGYSLIVLLISIWIIRRVNHPERKSVMPKALRSFGGRILQPVQYRKLAKAMILGSMVGVVMGVILNSYFGFHANQYLFSYLNSNLHAGLPANGTFLDPISTLGLKTLLLYSGYIGLFMVSFGLVLGMVNAYWMRSVKHAIGKFGWLCGALGIALTGLALLHHESLSSLLNPLSNPLIILIVVGIGLVIYGEGGQALIELPSIVSNIISYTRLLGILLATFVLAYLIDSVVVGPTSTGSPGILYGGVAYVILGVVLLVTVHVFNVILSILEPGIQGARLIFVEHFSKYLHGGGRQFTPFKGPRFYTTGTRSAKAVAERGT